MIKIPKIKKTPMKIAIDARTILNPEKDSSIGVGHYTYQLVRHILDLDKENQYTLFFDYRVREKDVKKFFRKNVSIKYFPWSDYRNFLPGVYSEILSLAALQDSFDVLHTTSPDARVPLGYQGKVICTFQDLAVYKYPKLYSTISSAKAKYNRKRMAKRADKIIAVSENTKKDVLDLFKVDQKKIKVIHNGVDERFFLDSSCDCAFDEGKGELGRKFGIEKKYILFVGTIEPIKNIPKLLEAFRIFKENLIKNGKENGYQLVIGGKRGWMADELVQNARDLGIADDVKFIGYVEPEDFVKLLRAAELFVMPSLYEGFGMTVLEAMATRVPCLVSNIGSLSEICNDSVEYCQPDSAAEMAEKMENLLDNQERRKSLKEKGYEQAQKFLWDKCARETLEVYREAAGK